MRRSMIAAIGVLVLVVVPAAAAIALTADDANDDKARRPMWGMMSDSSWSRSGGAAGTEGSMGRWMRGAWVDGEFAYLTEMVAHHEEAVAAAKELERSGRPEMRAFGAQIVATQSAQITWMTDWLAKWYRGRSAKVNYQPMMRDLSGLSGDRLDQAFLKDMIGHHMIAVMMSQQLLVRGLSDHDEVSELAKSIRDEQHAEILQMRRWLADWFGAGWECGSGRGMGPGMMW